MNLLGNRALSCLHSKARHYDRRTTLSFFSAARRFIGALAIVIVGLATPQAARAHDAPNSNILLDIGRSSIEAELQLPYADLALALALPSGLAADAAAITHADVVRSYVRQHLHAQTENGRAYTITMGALRHERINESDWLVATLRMQPPAGERADSLVLDYDVITGTVVNHNALLSIRHDFRHGMVGDDAKPVALLGYQLTHFKLDMGGGSWWRGFASVFSLGMQHIAEGTDHMLFLLVLLLPAPLVAVAGRWQKKQSTNASVWKIVKVVSGFTLGHSITLAFGALGWLSIPGRPVEVMIAVSILASALHAIRPVFRNKEVYLAAGFGLIHGLAFASSLSGLNYDTNVLVSSILGFNLGIETMQLAIVIVVLPCLLLMSRTKMYTPVRWGAALFATAAAVGWIGERALGLPNPASNAVQAVANQAPLLLATLAAAAVIAWSIPRIAVTRGLMQRIRASRSSAG